MLHRFFNRLWYQGHWSAWLFWPLTLLFSGLSRHRRDQYLKGAKPAYRPELPVIVVGNVSVGGTGKTPVCIWLIKALQQQGLRPGLVSRGYGGKAPYYPHMVSETDPASVTGDEPLMIHLRTGAPVVVDPDRSSAVRQLVDSGEVDVIISDDGLQHYRLSRTIELVVIDGERGFGSAKLLPMGPLRESVDRLATVDAILVNGEPVHSSLKTSVCQKNNVFPFTLLPEGWVALNSESEACLQNLQQEDQSVVHAVAGIGNPRRFFDTLTQMGISHQAHVFPDHYDYTELDLEPFEADIVLTTEKDAVKLRRFGRLRGGYLPVDAQVRPDLINVIMSRLDEFQQHHRHLY